MGDSHTFTTQLPLMSSPSVKLTLKLTQLSSTTLMEPATHMLLPPTLTIHTPPLLLDTHTTRLLLESQPTPLDTLTATEPHTPTVPTHTEMSTDGIEPLRRT